jgi:hypothetical protein
VNKFLGNFRFEAREQKWPACSTKATRHQRKIREPPHKTLHRTTKSTFQRPVHARADPMHLRKSWPNAQANKLNHQTPCTCRTCANPTNTRLSNCAQDEDCLTHRPIRQHSLVPQLRQEGPGAPGDDAPAPKATIEFYTDKPALN